MGKGRRELDPQSLLLPSVLELIACLRSSSRVLHPLPALLSQIQSSQRSSNAYRVRVIFVSSFQLLKKYAGYLNRNLKGKIKMPFPHTTVLLKSYFCGILLGSKPTSKKSGRQLTSQGSASIQCCYQINFGCEHMNTMTWVSQSL